jgi:hypothetical protein
LEVTGAASALLRLNWSESVELNETVAADITAGVLLLNEEIGRLLFLPYAGGLIVAYDLKEGEPVYPPVAIPRDEDRGMRMSIVHPDLFATVGAALPVLITRRGDIV